MHSIGSSGWDVNILKSAECKYFPAIFNLLSFFLFSISNSLRQKMQFSKANLTQWNGRKCAAFARIAFCHSFPYQNELHSLNSMCSSWVNENIFFFCSLHYTIVKCDENTHTKELLLVLFPLLLYILLKFFSIWCHALR